MSKRSPKLRVTERPNQGEFLPYAQCAMQKWDATSLLRLVFVLYQWINCVLIPLLHSYQLQIQIIVQQRHDYWNYRFSTCRRWCHDVPLDWEIIIITTSSVLRPLLHRHHHTLPSLSSICLIVWFLKVNAVFVLPMFPDIRDGSVSDSDLRRWMLGSGTS